MQGGRIDAVAGYGLSVENLGGVAFLFKTVLQNFSNILKNRLHVIEWKKQLECDRSF